MDFALTPQCAAPRRDSGRVLLRVRCVAALAFGACAALQHVATPRAYAQQAAVEPTTPPLGAPLVNPAPSSDTSSAVAPPVSVIAPAAMAPAVTASAPVAPPVTPVTSIAPVGSTPPAPASVVPTAARAVPPAAPIAPFGQSPAVPLPNAEVLEVRRAATPPGTYWIQIRAALTDRAFEIVERKERETFAQCTGVCTLVLPKGDYTVRYVTEEGRRGAVPLRVRASGDWVLEEPNAERATLGMTVGLIGIPLIVGGLAAVAYHGGEWCFSCSSSNQSTGLEVIEKVGAAAIIAGVVATPVGWITYLRNRRIRLLPDRNTHSAWRVTPALGMHFVGVRGSF